jgi:hypothetical protein
METVLYGTLNISVLALFYTLIGLLISVLLYHLFDDCDDTWKSEHLAYQLGDISVELGIIGTVAFWTTYIIRDYAPIFPVSKSLDILIDTYISGIFFAFAMFLFLGELSLKIKYLYQEHVHKYIVRYIPPNWSVMKMLFGTVKTNGKEANH